MDNAVVAFLNMVAVSELGQVILDNSDNGYNVLVGSTPDNIVTFDSYADHPRIVQKIVTRSGNTLYSSAAGRYQILSRMWDAYRPRLSLTDFGPDSQDAIAAQMLNHPTGQGFQPGFNDVMIILPQGINADGSVIGIAASGDWSGRVPC